MQMTLLALFPDNDGEYLLGPIKIDAVVPDFEEFEGPDKFRLVFHEFEQALLINRNKLGVLIAQEYLRKMSENRVAAKVEGQDGVTVTENTSPYRIEAELGRLNVTTYRAEKGNNILCNSKSDILPAIGSREAFRSPCYEWLQSKQVTESDYRASAETVNHIRWQDKENAVKLRTLRDSAVRDGMAVMNYLDAKAEEILKENNFDIKTGKPDHPTGISNESIKNESIPCNEVERVIAEYNAKNAHRGPDFLIEESRAKETFENPSECVNVSVDDIGVVEQKPTGREKHSKSKESTHYVKNTVAHIQYGDGRYIVTGTGIRHVLNIVVAFLLHNALFWGTPMVFFVDGADDLKGAIIDTFGWLSMRMVLDWYHLAKKCRYRLSMALRGKKVVHEVIKRLLPLLWHGKVEAAIEYLKSLDDTKVRNFKEIEMLIAYIERNRAYIPCYALRRALGLRVSSNLGEKANDLVVAQRQKHRGMSWSQDGSPALANLRMLFVNNEAYSWTVRRELDFRLIPASVSGNSHPKRLYSITTALCDKQCA